MWGCETRGCWQVSEISGRDEQQKRDRRKGGGVYKVLPSRSLLSQASQVGCARLMSHRVGTSKHTKEMVTKTSCVSVCMCVGALQ
jgi:hypothetical protein